MPPLHVNICGWIYKMSTGITTSGTWKRKWIVLCGNILWHYEDPWHMEHVKSSINCCNITDFIEESDGINFKMDFDEMTKKNEKAWDMRWDTDCLLEVKRTWRRRITAASPNLFKSYLKNLKSLKKKK